MCRRLLFVEIKCRDYSGYSDDSIGGLQNPGCHVASKESEEHEVSQRVDHIT